MDGFEEENAYARAEYSFTDKNYPGEQDLEDVTECQVNGTSHSLDYGDLFDGSDEGSEREKQFDEGLRECFEGSDPIDEAQPLKNGDVSNVRVKQFYGELFMYIILTIFILLVAFTILRNWRKKPSKMQPNSEDTTGGNRQDEIRIEFS